ncbi:MAG TPA: CoA transferase [Rhizomicrobium sp.]|jgi:crotonobetainyl-CoA:carnitine CoA-transferase CaiB-like acyl-CoA transferase|nr:CoA transferase [Rhizomicrobium sp.]
MRGALDGIRILEMPGARTQYGALLLAGMGAEVWLLEPPDGAPVRRVGPFAQGVSLPFVAHNSNKKSVVLDLSTAEGRNAFRKLAKSSDVVLSEDLPSILDAQGIGPAQCRADNPRLIWAALTPYGATGPRAQFAGSDLSAQAMGGGMSTTGEPGGRVYRAGGDVGDKMAGYTAASAVMVALLAREQSGRGQLIDVSAQEAVAGQMERGALFYQFTKEEPARGGRLYPTAAFPCGLFPANDGWISLVALQPQHWDALVDWVGDPRLAIERFKNGAERALARDEIDALLCEWSRKHSKHALAAEGQRRRIAIAALQTGLEVSQDPHLKAAGFFRALDHPALGTVTLPGAPFNASLTPFRMAHAAPDVGANNAEASALPVVEAPASQAAPAAAARPLSRYRILDLSWVIAGPACTRFLADQGAEVIKIESSGAGDPVRTFGPWLDGVSTAPEGGAAFALLNRNKRSMTLDLKKPEGKDLLLELVKYSDVVVDNFTAGTMDRLGLGYAQLAQANPRIVMAQISGFGQDGPYAHRVAYGQTLLALTGHYDQIGEADSTPLMPGYTYTDQAAGMISAFAILAALRHREETGAGQHLDLSLFQMGSSLMAEVLVEALVNGTNRQRLGNDNLAAVSHGAYRCKGADNWCVIATWTNAQFAALVETIHTDLPLIAARLRESSRRDVTDALIEEWTSLRNAEEVMARLQAVGVEAAIVQGARDVLESDEHLRARGFFQPFTHWPSGREMQIEGIPYALSEAPRNIAAGPPALGEANGYVFGELLNLTPNDIENLKTAGVIARD